MHALEFLGTTADGPGRWKLDARPGLQGAFGGTFGGALAAVAVAASRPLAPGRTPAGIDCRFLRGLSDRDAVVAASVLRQGRAVTVTSVEVTDGAGRLCTSAIVSLVDCAALHRLDLDEEPRPAPPGGAPWRMPPGIDIPIVSTLAPQVVGLAGGAIATVVRVPWDGAPEEAGAEAACLAGDLCVGPPVAAACRGTWVPHPNPDLSLRFTGAAPGEEVVGVGRVAGIEGGLAAVTVEVVSSGRPIAAGVATSLLLKEA